MKPLRRQQSLGKTLGAALHSRFSGHHLSIAIGTPSWDEASHGADREGLSRCLGAALSEETLQAFPS